MSVGEILLKQNLISQSQLDIALSEQRKTNSNIIELLASLGFVSTPAIMNAISNQSGFKYIRFKDFPKTIPIDKYPTVEFMKQHNVVPLGKSNGVLKIVMADPFDVYIRNALELFSPRIDIYISTASDIQEAISQYFENIGGMNSLIEDINIENISSDILREDVHHLRDIASEAPIIKIVNMLITRAIEDRASDIHIEPFENNVKVRYRIDSILREVETIPNRLHLAIISRLKIMARLNIAERRLPQDGRIKLRILGKEIDLRVSVLPSIYGEGIVMRILDKEMALVGLSELGFSNDTLERYKSMITSPYGMILVTGPTGSGKTTTLYASLYHINSSDKKIITIEDPVEYEIQGVNQIHINPKIGLTFANGLRHIVRQDPDIIMVGEIRDKETAEISVHSALTGHLVFSTLHTNDASGAITRLLDMGIENFLVSSSVIGILAQRLVRVICHNCKTSLPPTPEILKKIGIQETIDRIFYGKGCEKCRHTGYIGRTGIFEFLPVDEGMRNLVLTKASIDKIRQYAIKKGMRTLRQDGWHKIKSGITTPDEVIRITQEGSSADILL